MKSLVSVLFGSALALCAIVGSPCVTAAETVTYYYTNEQGTPLATTDAAGNIVTSADYRPYGTQTLGLPAQAPGYTGHVNDADTELVYMQARYYDPAVGRFMSTDPIGPSGGDAGKFNRYTYANDNPSRFVDPDGREVAISGAPADVKRFEAQAYKLTGIHTKNVNGKLVQVGQRNTKVGYAGAAKALTAAIKSTDTISIGVVKNDPNVVGDSFNNNKFDIGDFRAFAGKSTKFGAALFTHVIAERSFDAANGSGLKTIGDFGAAHAAGLSAENAVMGASSRTNDGTVIGPGGQIDFDYQDAGGTTTQSFSVKQDKNMVLH
jgi:RHS repeat-associated protein